MKLTFGKTSFAEVGNKTICSIPYKFTFNYDEGKSGIRSACQHLLNVIAKESNIPLSGKATASTICHKDDIYTKTLGHRVAEAKAKAKAYRTAYLTFYVLYKHITNLNIGLMEALDKADELYDGELNHFDALLGINQDKDDE